MDDQEQERMEQNASSALAADKTDGSSLLGPANQDDSQKPADEGINCNDSILAEGNIILDKEAILKESADKLEEVRQMVRGVQTQTKRTCLKPSRSGFFGPGSATSFTSSG